MQTENENGTAAAAAHVTSHALLVAEIQRLRDSNKRLVGALEGLYLAANGGYSPSLPDAQSAARAALEAAKEVV